MINFVRLYGGVSMTLSITIEVKVRDLKQAAEIDEKIRQAVSAVAAGAKIDTRVISDEEIQLERLVGEAMRMT